MQYISFGDFSMSVDLFDSTARPFTIGSDHVPGMVNPDEASCSYSGSTVHAVSDAQLANLFQSNHRVLADQSVHLENLNYHHDMVSVHEPSLGSTVVKSALKKTTPLDCLNLGTGFLVCNHDNFGSQGSGQLAVTHLAQCSRCLRWGHSNKYCRHPVRCVVCFKYGHRAKSCFLQPKTQMLWMPKKKQSANDSGPKIMWKPRKPIAQ